MKAFDLTEEQLTDGTLADLCRKIGYSSLRSMINDHNCWDMEVDELENALRDQLRDIESMEIPASA